jgi:hypothetical protein
MKNPPALILSILLLLTAVLLGLPAWPAEAQSQSPIIYACIQKNSGQTRIVAAAGDCSHAAGTQQVRA